MMNMNVGIAEILKDVIQGKEIEDSLKEKGINEILKSQGIPLKKRGEEIIYQINPDFSLYNNPGETGIRFEKRFAEGGIASAITKIKKNPKVEKYAVGALVPIGGAISRAAPTAISRIVQILRGNKVKNMGPAKVVDDVVDAKIVDDVAKETIKRGGNIFSRNPVTSTLTGLGLAAGLTPSFLGGGEEETTNLDSSDDDSDVDNGGNGDGGTIDLSGVRGETLGVYARKRLQQQGFFFNEETGKFESRIDPNGNVIQGKPKFLDYLKAFGGGYLEKTAEDPEFAKKMMAGFAAMTMPKEGPTGFSPLGLSEFTQGYLSADLALQEAKPADQKLLEYLQQNPDQAGALENLERARLGLDKGELEEAYQYYATLFDEVRKRDGLPSADAKDFYLVTPDGKPFMEFEALNAYKNLSSEDFIKLRDSLKLKSIKN
tara:strand:- start:10697 stop:11989 length:1293 start_codon:yes stop_codon:yes gene_type:complete